MMNRIEERQQLRVWQFSAIFRPTVCPLANQMPGLLGPLSPPCKHIQPAGSTGFATANQMPGLLDPLSPPCKHTIGLTLLAFYSIHHSMGEGVKKSENLADVIDGRPLSPFLSEVNSNAAP